MGHTVTLLMDTVNTTGKVIRMDKHFAGVDWGWVRKVTHIENPYDGRDVSILISSPWNFLLM